MWLPSDPFRWYATHTYTVHCTFAAVHYTLAAVHWEDAVLAIREDAQHCYSHTVSAPPYAENQSVCPELVRPLSVIRTCWSGPSMRWHQLRTWPLHSTHPPEYWETVEHILFTRHTDTRTHTQRCMCNALSLSLSNIRPHLRTHHTSIHTHYLQLPWLLRTIHWPSFLSYQYLLYI